MVVGVDAHKKTHTLVAVDPLGRRTDQLTVVATPAGHRQACEWLQQFGQVLVAIEDCRHLTRRFEVDPLNAGHSVVRVHTRLMGWRPAEWCSRDLGIAPGHGAAIA